MECTNEFKEADSKPQYIIESKPLYAFQEKRRQIIKEIQKTRREAILAETRKLFIRNKQKNDKSENPNEVEAKSTENPSETVKGIDVLADKMKELDLTNQKNIINNEEETKKGPGAKTQREKKTLRRNKQNHYAQQFTMPEWLVTVPMHLNEDLWYAMPKPEGIRALVIAESKKTVSRNKNGFIMQKFVSYLPGGWSLADHDKTTVLDTIYVDSLKTYYVLDILFLKDAPVFQESTEIRQLILENHVFGESKANLADFSEHNEFKFVLLPKRPCNSVVLQSCYNDSTPYAKDGILFYHKEAAYLSALHGTNPYILHWKDQFSSLYPFETEEGKEINDDVLAVLKVDVNNGLKTFDEVPVAEIDEKKKENLELVTGNLITVALKGMKLNEMAGSVQEGVRIDKAEPLKKPPVKKACADSLSKIIFQFQLRHKPLTYQELEMAIALNNKCKNTIFAGEKS